jgi:hypothetical protein
MGDRQLLRGLPVIRRARGFRLYDTSGRRYLDLFRDGALLGHRGSGTVTAMKSALSQGLAAALPSSLEKRLIAALVRAFPKYREVRLYSSRDRALEAVSRCLGGGTVAVRDPATDFDPSPDTTAGFWRPFLPLPDGLTTLLPLLPFTVCGAPAPVCFSVDVPSSVPGSEVIPGFVLAAALQGFSALPGAAGDDFPLSNPGVEGAVDGARGWARVGPYVRALFQEAEYPRVHAEFLRAGVFLHPGYPGPSVLPGECSPGECRLLARLFTAIPGG